jgi:hypothetical protein
LESLALFASLIISLTALGGPLAVIKILAFLIAIIAIFIGAFLAINVNSIGARIIGVFGITTAILAIYRVIKVIPKI